MTKKLSNLRIIGRYRNPETGNPVNIHKGTKVGYGTDILFYLQYRKRIYLSELEFYQKWIKI